MQNRILRAASKNTSISFMTPQVTVRVHTLMQGANDI